ncbi:MAG: cupin domain-containing protein [Alphaproteobacteria bacterium]|nr:cupin domain-containing protein [Alphaproteobacteria bacterium]
MSSSAGQSPEESEIIAHRFDDDGSIPNNPTLPLLIYPGALDLTGSDPAGACIERFAAHGWSGAWRNGIYPFPHYHSTAHEALGVCRGKATVRLGGDKGLTIEIKAGDALVLPAGTGHQDLGSSPDLLVVGAYPSGMDWDLCRCAPDERPEVLDNIKRVPLPVSDPIHGNGGPLLRFWQAG